MKKRVNIRVLICISIIHISLIGTCLIFYTSPNSTSVVMDESKREQKENKTHFVTAQTNNMFLFSAYIERDQDHIRTALLTEDKIVVIGWLLSSVISKKLKCCILDHQNNVRTSDVTESTKIIGHANSLYITSFECPFRNNKSVDITGISLTLLDMTCSMNHIYYITPTILSTTIKRNKIALCPNTNLYRSVSAKRLVEWFEICRFLGVDKFTIHPHPSLNSSAKMVLSFYEKEGLAEVFETKGPFETGPRGVKKYIAEQWIAEHVGFYDCRERNKYYDLVALFDIDELLLPADIKENAYKSILADLRQGNVGIMAFYNYLHILEWKAANANHSLIFGRYEDASEPIADTTKHIYMPSRTPVLKGSYHEFPTKPGFSKKFADPKVLAIHHYRECREEWSTRSMPVKIFRNGKVKAERQTCETFKRTRFESVKEFLSLKTINDNVQRVCSALKISE